MHIGIKIRQLRKAKGFTQAQLGATAFGVSESVGQTRVNRIEHGLKQVTDVELLALQEVLQVAADEFMGFYDNYHYLETMEVAKIVEAEYPELRSFRNALALGIRQRDPILIRNAWEMLLRCAQLQLTKGTTTAEPRKKPRDTTS
jgi:transcriptional regulator with XRE-family HTH domain